MNVSLGQFLNLDEVQNLLSEIRTDTAEFCFHDPLYPSPSDPGAYLSYSAKLANDGYWQLTLGNHGWSGGIYIIPSQVVELQISNLIKKGLLESISTENVSFFSHYKIMSDPSNQKCIDTLISSYTNKT